MKLSKLFGLMLVVFLGLSISYQAQAQDEAQDEVSQEVKNSKKKKKKKKEKAEKSTAYMSLGDLLRRQGVMVQGSGSGAKVTIRGGGGGANFTDPLFVIDRVPIGNSYAQAEGMVDVNDIDRINVLKGADASQYGARGNSGVIEIYTKKS